MATNRAPLTKQQILELPATVKEALIHFANDLNEEHPDLFRSSADFVSVYVIDDFMAIVPATESSEVRLWDVVECLDAPIDVVRAKLSDPSGEGSLYSVSIYVDGQKETYFKKFPDYYSLERWLELNCRNVGTVSAYRFAVAGSQNFLADSEKDGAPLRDDGLVAVSYRDFYV